MSLITLARLLLVADREVKLLVCHPGVQTRTGSVQECAGVRVCSLIQHLRGEKKAGLGRQMVDCGEV